jgi:hypothetical protein
MERDPMLLRIERTALVVCGGMALVAAVAYRGVAVAAGVAGGGLLVAISYRGIKGGIEAVSGGGGRRGAVAIGLVKFFTRYGILAAVAYVIMVRLRLPPVAVVAGASSLVVAIAVEAVRQLWHDPADRTGTH